MISGADSRLLRSLVAPSPRRVRPMSGHLSAGRVDHLAPEAGSTLPHVLGRRGREGFVARPARGAPCGRATSDDCAARSSPPGCTIGRKHRRKWQPRGARRQRTASTPPSRIDLNGRPWTPSRRASRTRRGGIELGLVDVPRSRYDDCSGVSTWAKTTSRAMS
jgi:hypothetical protein